MFLLRGSKPKKYATPSLPPISRPTERGLLCTLEALDPLSSLSTFGSNIYCGFLTGAVLIFDATTGQISQELDGHRAAVRSVLALDEPNMFCTASADETIRIWEAAQRSPVRRLVGHNGPVESLCAANPSTIYSGGADGSVRRWNLRSGQCEQKLVLHVGAITDLALADRVLFTCSPDGLAKGIDLETGKLIALYEGLGPLRCICHINEPNLLVAGTAEGPVRLYDVRSANCVTSLRGHNDCVFALGLLAHEGASLVFSGSDDRTIRRWDLRMLCCTWVFNGHADAVKGIALSGTDLITGSFDRTVNLWNSLEGLNSPRTSYGLPFAVGAADGSTVDYLRLVKDAFIKHAVQEQSRRLLPRPSFCAAMNDLQVKQLPVIDGMFQIFDQNQDGEVELEEVMLALRQFLEGDERERVLRECFNIFDDDGSGKISLVEVNLLAARGEKTMVRLGITPTMIKEMVSLIMMDPDRSGSMTYAEFREWVLTRPTLIKELFPMISSNFCRSRGLSVTPLTESEAAKLRAKYSKAKSNRGSPKRRARTALPKL
eukprot:TRINITY_DN14290_c0_g1_i1.p1 TRINITY_DN14290_c0_g1~~TRINITY_DN14290_c0_g1_i1.p1  ORF type:complete len:545 (-),score=66.78 TRINITY_DN14290_c0_g1_i1:136-1770(-)